MFYQQYWNTCGFLQSSKINDLIKQKYVTIQEILEEDNILNEIKQAQENFSNFLIKNPKHIQELIDYCIQEQEIDSKDPESAQKKVKYSFIASEIFAAQLPNLAKFLFGEYTRDNLSEDQENETEDLNDGFYMEDKKKAQKDKNNSTENNNFNIVESDLEEEKNAQSEEKEQKAEDSNGATNSENDTKDSSNNQDEKEEGEQKEGENGEKDEKDEKIQEEGKENGEKVQPKPEITGPELLAYIFEFLDRDDKYDHFSTSAGYFSKIVVMLYCFELSMWKYLNENPQVLKNFLKHIDNKSIAELIQKLLISESFSHTFYETEQKGKEDSIELYSENKKKIINELFQIYGTSEDEEVLDNIAYILTDILSSCSSLSTSKQIEVLIEQIYQKQNLDILYQKLPTTDNNVCFHTASILNQLILVFTRQSDQSDTIGDEDEVQTDEGNTFQTQLEDVASKIQILLSALEKEKIIVTYQNQFGSETKPFGLGRLKIVEIFSNLLKCKSPFIYQALAQTNFFQVVFQLFKEYQWNDLLHCLVEKILKNTLESENDDLIKTMLKQSDIAQIIINCSTTGQKIKPGNYQIEINNGNFGHLTLFANILIEYMEKNVIVKNFFSNENQWEDFVNNSLKETNEILNQKLGGDPNDSDNESEEKNEKIIDLMKKFGRYFAHDKSDADQSDEQQEGGNDEDNKPNNFYNDNFDDDDEEENQNENNSNPNPYADFNNQDEEVVNFQDEQQEVLPKIEFEQQTMEDNWVKAEMLQQYPEHKKYFNL